MMYIEPQFFLGIPRTSTELGKTLMRGSKGAKKTSSLNVPEKLLYINRNNEYLKHIVSSLDIFFLVRVLDKFLLSLEVQKWIRFIRDRLSSLKIQPYSVLARNITDVVSYHDQNLVNDYCQMNPSVNSYVAIMYVNSVWTGQETYIITQGGRVNE